MPYECAVCRVPDRRLKKKAVHREGEGKKETRGATVLKSNKMPPHIHEQTTNLLTDSNHREPQFEDCTGVIKCVLVGDGAVGKTSLVVSYTTNGYPTEYVPTAFDNYRVIVTVDNQPYRLQLCDTAGQDDFDSLIPLCYPGTDVFLLCFSVVSPTSFYNIRDKWLPEIRRHCPSAPVVLVGTQCDLRTSVKVLIELDSYREQPVPENAAKLLAQQIGAACYLESSALTQRNLKEVFDTAILVALQQLRSTSKSKGHKALARKGFTQKQKQHQYCPAAMVLSNGNLTAHAQKVMMAKQRKKGWKKYCCCS